MLGEVAYQLLYCQIRKATLPYFKAPILLDLEGLP
jgi:hypothetical protein